MDNADEVEKVEADNENKAAEGKASKSEGGDEAVSYGTL